MVTVLYENDSIIVCLKQRGVSSQESHTENMPSLLRQHLKNEDAYIGVVHRLDTLVGGIMVYAKTQKAAAYLSEQIKNGCFTKEYLASVSGKPENDSGIYQDLLFKDSRKNKSFVVKRERKGVKSASLQYSLIDTAVHTDTEISLVRVKLITGRTHQIRVQFSARKMPLLGDKKYGSRFDCPLSLWSYKISFTNPENGESLIFTALPENIEPWDKFDIAKLKAES